MAATHDPKARPGRRRSFAGFLVALATALGAVAVPAVAFPAAASAAGSTYVVDQANAACSDTGPGNAAQPFCTIGQGAKVALAGDTVQVLAGTYPENVNEGRSGTAGSPITFSGAPGAIVTGGVQSGAHAFTISGRSYITVEGFTVSDTVAYGIYVFGSSNITISNNHVSRAGLPQQGSTAAGIYVNSTTGSAVIGNTSEHNSDSGILLTNNSTGNMVRGNTTFANAQGWQRAAPGIDVRSGPNTVAGNLSYANEDSGLQFYTGAHDNLVVGNVSYGNGDHGIDDLNAPNQTIVGNSVYKNVTAGINAEGTSTGVVIRNNISVDNGINSPRTTSNIRVDGTSNSSGTVDDNEVFLTGGSVEYTWGNVGYTSLAAFQQATGQEAHGLQADPLWRAPGSGDFHLTAGSPAIDSADSNAAGEPDADFDGNPRVDDPATPNTGTGVRTFDDRGAFEFQPSGPPPVDNPPTAALTITPSTGQAPLAVTADASASTDDHGIASYAFDWGDGQSTASQPGATAQHSYASAGTYPVTVTVLDTAGQSATATQSVIVNAVPDNPPTAALTITPATGQAPLAVTADASASTDDHGIASYAFDWGDGQHTVSQASATAQHSYGSAGTYTVTVTVLDTAGQSGTASQNVTVTSPAGTGIAFDGAAHTVISSSRPTVKVPTTVHTGDTMLLYVTVNSASPTVRTPSGWTKLGRAVITGSASMASSVYRRTASATDPGATVTVTLSASAQVDLALVAYAGVNPSAPVAASTKKTDTTSTSSHSTPTVTLATAGDWVVSYWSDRSSTTTRWSAPTTVTARDASYGTGTARVTALVADSAGPQGAIRYPALTATTNAASNRAVMWSVALAPAP